ncbi:aminoglycoside phosphotransferase family protein [Amycolatopsis japonica]|uniref:phosphotransferase enzyme family protein n=1 Tax=Amycolatopsis japonica TaxID=208439 RepID=UPI00331EFC5D
MTTTTPFTPERARTVLDEACNNAYVDSSKAVSIRFGENALYSLADNSLIGRVGRSVPAAIKEVKVAKWLNDHGFPAAKLATGMYDQPVVEDGLPVTFWEFITERGEQPTAAEFGKILHDLHALPSPDFDLPKFSPMPKFEARITHLDGQLPESDLTFLRSRYEKISAEFEDLEFELPPGPIHGDAHPGNVMRSTDGNLYMIDFEDFAYGPREWDAAVLSVRHQAFGWASDAEYRSYADAYGFDPIDWPGFPVIRAARELNMTMWLAQKMDESQEVEAEVYKRLSDLRDDQAPRSWRVF